MLCVIAILEHKVKEGIANKMIQKIAPGWRYEETYAFTAKVRIWILWDPQYAECDVGNKFNHIYKLRVRVKGSGA